MSNYSLPADASADERCRYARFFPSSAPANGDVDGTAVTVAFFITTICFHIDWFSPPARGFLAYLIQVYTILIAILWSIHRQELSLFDATFALRLTSSPSTMFAIGRSLGGVYHITSVFRLRADRLQNLVITVLGTLLPFLWLGLGITLRYFNHAFTDGELCEGSTFRGWFTDMIYAVGWSTPYNTTGLLIVGIPCILLMYIPPPMEFYQDLLRLRRESGPWRWFRIPLILWGYCGYSMEKHPWTTLFAYVSLESLWAHNIISSAVAASGKHYALTYGQMLSIICAVPPVLITAKSVYSHRRYLLGYLSQRFYSPVEGRETGT